MANIAFLGLGGMGSRMAARLLAAGHRLTVWNRTAAATKPLEDKGARAAASPAEAVRRADTAISMLSDDTASRFVWLDNRTGAINGLSPQTHVIESSTVSPGWIAELGKAVSGKGATLIDAPVAGTLPQAEGGQLIFMTGGMGFDIERARPILLCMGNTVHQLGPLGNGAKFKLAVNALLAGQVALAAEVSSYLTRAGFDQAHSVDVLSTMPVTSPATAVALRNILAGSPTPFFTIELMAKDLGYVMGEAAANHAAMPVTTAVRSIFERARSLNLGSRHMTAVAEIDT
jgi:3-hydroxyisobutyrate dehydrogenase